MRKAFQNEIPKEVRRAATLLLPPALVADVDEYLQERKKVTGLAKTVGATEVAQFLEENLAGLPEFYAE